MDAFASVDEVQSALGAVGYISDAEIATVVRLAVALEKPILVEGPAGTGKTQLAKSLAEAAEATLYRLQCYEGLDEAKALYEWNYRKQLLRIQASQGTSQDGSTEKRWSELEDDLFSEEFLLTRPVLAALQSTTPAVLLIDEIDRVEVETEALLLEVLAEFQLSIPELGTISAERRPVVVLTSNNTRELSEALKRRCLYLHLGFPSPEREQEILTSRVPGISDELATKVAQTVAALRELDLKKPPSVSEAIDWARTLVVLEKDDLDSNTLVETLPVVLKWQKDIDTTVRALGLSKP